MSDALKGEDGATVTESYARGKILFCGIELAALPGALVARKETELLARAAIDILKKRPGAQTVIDMCTGSGNLACAIAHHVEDAVVFASDLTDGCVAAARKNVEDLGLGQRVTVVQGDLFAPLQDRPVLLGAVDVVVCNPPYISTGKLEKDAQHLLENEPREAFDAGPFGIAIHQRVVKDALAFLKPGGVLAFEIGAGQEKQVGILFQRAKMYDAPIQLQDEAGTVRSIYAIKKDEVA